MAIFIELKEDLSEKVRYDYSDYPIYIRRELLSTYPNYTAPSHWHDDIELIAILSGEMQYNVNGEIISLKSGEGILVNARQMHFGFSSVKSECSFICILLHPMLLCVNHAYERDFVLPLINNRNTPFIKLLPKILWQRKICNQIELMHAIKDEKAAPIKVQTAFLKIWTALFENISITNNESIPQNIELTVIKNMIGFIQKNYSEKISLADIATSGAVGQSKCCKIFAKYLSQTPINYLTFYRLNKSMELLDYHDMTISEIAYEVGFGGASYFAETFRKCIGQSPSEYRKLKTSE